MRHRAIAVSFAAALLMGAGAVQASDTPAETGTSVPTDTSAETTPSVETSSTTSATTATIVVTSDPSDSGAVTVQPDEQPTTGTIAPSSIEPSTSVTTTVANAQVTQHQQAVVTATVVADANTGSNVIVDDQPSGADASPSAEVATGDGVAVGSADANVVDQSATVVLSGGARANVTQIALIINVGAALANSGYNVVTSGPGGSGISGAITTGNASAIGLDIDQYITQGVAQSADEDTDANSSQMAVSLWMGLASANSGTNSMTGSGAGGSAGAVATGTATATGNRSVTDISQVANIVGSGQSTTNITQRATVLNLGFALANSGLNELSGVAGGLLTADESDDDELTQQLFAMLLPAMLQSYGYGPAQGSVSTGDASAVGNSSETFVLQVANAAASGDGAASIVQDVLVANMGAASANTGGNTLGAVRPLDRETADTVVVMAAFMADMLSIVHQEADATNLRAASRGIDIPYQGLILRLDAGFEGLDVRAGQGGAQANIRQVSVVFSLGLGSANTGGNRTMSDIDQGSRVNGLQAGDSLAVMALDDAGNVISTGAANAANRHVVVICQRLQTDDLECLAPPPTTEVPTTTVVAPGTTLPGSPLPTPGGASSATTLPLVGVAAELPAPATSVAGTSAAGPTGVGFASAPLTLPATGVSLPLPSLIAAAAIALGLVLLGTTRSRNHP